MSYEVIDLDDESDLAIASTQKESRSIEILEIDCESETDITKIAKTQHERTVSINAIESSSQIADIPSGCGTEQPKRKLTALDLPHTVKANLKTASFADRIMGLAYSDSDDEISILHKTKSPVKSLINKETPNIRSTTDRDVVSQTELKSNTNRLNSSPNTHLFVEQTNSIDAITLLSSPIQQSTQLKFSSPLRNVQYSQTKSITTNPPKRKLQYDDDDFEIQQHKHNVLLSSPEQKDNSDYKKRLPVTDLSFDALADSSSSIGQIEVSSRVTKSLLPEHQLKKINNLIQEGHQSKNLKTSNAFLDKLNTLEVKTKKKLDILRRELNHKETNKENDIVEKEKMSNITKIRNNCLSELSFSEPINNSFADDSICIDISDSDEDNEPEIEKENDPIMPQYQPAKRTLTTNSARSRTTKEERETLKNQKEKEKRDKKLYQELNKSKRSKDELLSEMIINIPRKIKDLFESGDLNLNDELKPIQIKSVMSGFGEIKENLIIWERKSNSKYDPNLDVFQPVEFHIIKERQSCLVFNAKDFIKVLESSQDHNGNFDDDKIVQKLHNALSFTKDGKEGYSNLIILIVGLDSFISKLKNIENSEYTKRVRENLQASQNPDAVPSNQTTKRKTKTKEPLTKLSILQIETIVSKLRIHGMKIFPTKNLHETMMWLKSFTYTISGSRYDKYERNQDLANIGTIKSGINKPDTYEKMLSQFRRMTSVRIGGIVGDFKTLKDLFEYINEGNDMVDYVGNSELEKEMTTFFRSLDENDILKP